MRGARPHELALAGVGAAAWTARLIADHRAIRADPAYKLLHTPLKGRPLPVDGADGTPLHALEFGPSDADSTVVLVHGWTCALQIWTCQIQSLVADGVRVVAYDLRGHGRSGRPDESRDYSIDAHAGDLDAVLHAAMPDGGRAVVAGHSLGGMTIIAWAGDHPDEVEERISGAVLVNTGMGDLISQSFILRAPKVLQGARQLAGRVILSATVPLPKGPTPLSFRLVRHIAMSPSASPAQVAFTERIALACKRDVRAACGGTISKLDLYEAIKSLTVPTVIIAGEQDKLTPPGHVRRLADTLPDVVEEILLPKTGHMGPVSNPDAVTEPIMRLVRDARRVPAAVG